jgi:hypothetical protein
MYKPTAGLIEQVLMEFFNPSHAVLLLLLLVCLTACIQQRLLLQAQWHVQAH